MNFLLTPVLVAGLLFSPAPAASECEGTAEARPVCADCGGAVKLEPAQATDDVARQARKHSDYYRLLVRAQRDASEHGRQYMVQLRPSSDIGAE